MDEALRDRLADAFASGPPAWFAVLFGSEALGTARPDSDLDIAWLPVDPDVPLAAELDLQVELTVRAGREVDLVRVDRTSTLCRMEIARHAVWITGDRDRWIAFRADAIAEFLDFEPALRDVSRRFAARLKREAAARRT